MSDIGGRYDLIQPFAIVALAKIMERGAKTYGENKWKKIHPKYHVGHALMHIAAYMAGDDSEEDGDIVEHLRHALWRLASAVDSFDSGRFEYDGDKIQED